MGDATEDRQLADRLPEGDVVRVLLEQHARVRELFSEVKSASGEEKKQLFDELRALLAVHETAEEMVLRPVSSAVAGQAVADARNEEEARANSTLAELEKVDSSTAEFDRMLAELESAVDEHARLEESEEFPEILEACDAEQRRGLGLQVQAAASIAPTHPHPSTAGSPTAQWVAGPFASMVDRTRDALRAAASDRRG